MGARRPAAERAGDAEAAWASLAALRELDPGDPHAAQLASFLAGEAVVAASEEVRLTNIAKLANTALLRNPYQVAIGAIFEAIRGDEIARVLDVGVGSGAQLVELLALLRTHEHRVRRIELPSRGGRPATLWQAHQPTAPRGAGERA